MLVVSTLRYIDVEVGSPPVPEFYASTYETSLLSSSVYFKSTSQRVPSYGTGPLSDGAVFNTESFLHHFEDTGTYEITLIVSSGSMSGHDYQRSKNYSLIFMYTYPMPLHQTEIKSMMVLFRHLWN
jgi:hypothetical protein